MSPEKAVTAITTEFFRRVNGARWGVLGRIQTRLGLNKNFFNGWRNAPARPRLLPLFGAIEVLGIRPLEFFVTALKDDAACGPATGELAARLMGTSKSSPELERALKILQAVLAPKNDQVQGIHERFAQRWSLLGEAVGNRGKAWLKELDEVRYTNAPKVVAAIEEHLEQIEPDEIPFALGVLGSAYRLIFAFDSAEAYIKQGLELADEVLDHSTAGELHQRLSMVWSDRGAYHEAFSQNCFAIARHHEGENPVGVARAMVDRGIIQGHRGRYQWSTNAFHEALERLPESETKNRATALHGLAHNYIAQGDRNVAIRFALKAERIPVDPLNSAKLTWSTGAIFATAGQYLDAFPRLRKARQTLEALAPVDAALVTIDICEVFLLSGQPGEAYKETKKMLAFLKPLRAKTVLAEGAAYELAATGVRGKGLTFAALATARARINAKPASRL